MVSHYNLPGAQRIYLRHDADPIFDLSLIAVATRNARYHAFFAVFFLLYMSLFIGVNLLVLN